MRSVRRRPLSYFERHVAGGAKPNLSIYSFMRPFRATIGGTGEFAEAAAAVDSGAAGTFGIIRLAKIDVPRCIV